MLKVKELRDQTAEELKMQNREISKDLYNLSSEARINKKLEKPHLIREKKRDRARILTILREKGA